VVDEGPAEYLENGHRLSLASGTRVELRADAVAGNLLGLADPECSPWSHRLAGEPFDRYRRSGDVLAEEIRGMAPVSLLEVAVRTGGGCVRMLVVQDDEARWALEDKGVLGEDFEDHLERNACWAALGIRRPRDGWTVSTEGS
jgi:hypothetical protein